MEYFTHSVLKSLPPSVFNFLQYLAIPSKFLLDCYIKVVDPFLQACDQLVFIFVDLKMNKAHVEEASGNKQIKEFYIPSLFELQIFLLFNRVNDVFKYELCLQTLKVVLSHPYHNFLVLSIYLLLLLVLLLIVYPPHPLLLLPFLHLTRLLLNLYTYIFICSFVYLHIPCILYYCDVPRYSKIFRQLLFYLIKDRMI